MSRALAALAALAVAAGCALGPNYKRPSVPMSSAFRGQARAEAASFADLPWWDVFQDPSLKALLVETLTNNYDLADASARVDVARENARIGTDRLLPSLSATGGPSYQQVFFGVSLPGMSSNARFAGYQLQGSLSWEIDLWGRLRRLRQSAIADFFASEDNRRGVIVSLIGDVAQSYFTLLALDLALEVTRRTVRSREDTLVLFRERLAGGVGDALDTTAEEALLADARATIPNLERQIVQTENQLAYLMGRPPGPIARGGDLLRRPAPLDQPAGLPASLLERRPDVRRAEAQLISANAQVGAALAALFPTISLAGSGGVESNSLSTLFTSGSVVFGVSLLFNWLAPILNGAEYVHRWRGQKAAYRAALADYRRTVLSALVEVSNALTAIATLREQRAQLELEVRALTERLRLAKLRFRNGVASYLDVVQAEQNLFPAELTLAQTIGAQFSAVAQLYRALGGGWRTYFP
ncbi:MAG TPA: efflux transporter outer membrane subunit [Polyangia bacterium]|nr:efflux transporter outer membrane subunit [Polyangia bacterium]